MQPNYTLVYGITADPIHKGHEQAIINGINYCQKNKLIIAEFIIIPVYNPHLIANKKSPVASYSHRFKMCQLLAKRLTESLKTSIKVSNIEKYLSKSSNAINYSYNTLKHLQANNFQENSQNETAKKNCLFMVSADHFTGRWPKFRNWANWKKLLKICGLLINQRPNNKINAAFVVQLKTFNQDIYCIKSSHQVDVSSSQIRKASKRSLAAYAISEDIIHYIEKNSLYETENKAK